MPDQDRANELLQKAIEQAQSGGIIEAMRLFSQVLEIVPGNPVVLYNQGLAQQRAGMIEESVISYKAAIGFQPQFSEAWINLSQALMQLDRDVEALEAAETALKFEPSQSSAWLAKGNALRRLHKLDKATEAFQSGLQLTPADRQLKLSLANATRDLGQLNEAIQLLRETIEAHPDFAEAHRDLAHALLLNGEYQEGWIENRWRWDTASMLGAKRHQSIPEWTGQPLAGRRILIWDEQGFGDSIQFVRYVPWVSEMGGEILLEVQPQLVRLFETIEGTYEIFNRGAEISRVDYQVPLINLPDVFCSDPNSVPNSVPYLKVDPSFVGKSGKVRVGLCWAGNPVHDNDRNRSLQFELFKPLLELTGIDFVGLQIGSHASENIPRIYFTDILQDPVDFYETAELVASLDLVITVDTAVAHLTGALGRKLWVLLPFAPDWRWMLSRDSSLWYPNAKLFRQPAPGNWVEPVLKIREKLINFFNSKESN